VSIVLESEYFHGVGAFEVHLLKVSALKLSHPSVCSVFQNFSRFSILRHSLLGERDRVRGSFCDEIGGASLLQKYH
jgi:hypothetical protein